MRDYHVHSGFLDHTKDDLDSIIKTADRLGFEEIAITEHLIWSAMVYPKKGEDTLFVEKSQIPDDGRQTTDLPTYFWTIDEIASRYKIRVLKGLEVDYYDEYEEQIRAILGRFDVDIVLGSCHYVCNDELPENEKYVHVGLNQRMQLFIERFGTEKLYEVYFNSIKKAAMSGLFDYMAHLDFIKKVVPDYCHKKAFAHILPILEIMINMNVGLEINLKGMKKFNEPFPSHEVISEYKRLGGRKISIGSDSHSVKQLVNTQPLIKEYEQKFI